MSRELDAEVAERVMGIPRSQVYYTVAGQEHITELLPLYSTDIAAAWAVVEKMRELEWQCHMRGWVTVGDWQCGFLRPGTEPETVPDWVATRPGWSTADTAPMAICRAALLALAASSAGEGARDEVS